jgi:hypothetical protein
MRRFFAERWSMFVVVLYPMNRTSSGAESGSPAIYDSRRAVCFDVVSVENFGFWTWCSDVVFVIGLIILAFVSFEICFDVVFVEALFLDLMFGCFSFSWDIICLPKSRS